MKTAKPESPPTADRLIADAERGAEIVTKQMREFQDRDANGEKGRKQRAREYALWRAK